MGGKRKKSNNGPIKKESKYKIPTRFDCPLCDSKASIVVKIFRATSDATVRCRVCGAGGTKRWKVLRLEKPVDVFFRFHEALIQKDQQDLQQVEMTREMQQARLSGNVASPSTVLTTERAVDGIDGVQHGGAALGGDRSWVDGSASLQQPAVTAAAGGAAAPTAAPRHVRSLGELQRKLAMSVAPTQATLSSRAIELDDDFEREAEGAAAHYFAPRPEVHSGHDEDDEYDQLFQ
ncbi:Transcription elongation factor Elf1 like [Lotmaria passim]